MTIDSTLAGEFSNSYVDVAFADDYFTNHYDSTKAASWAALSSGAKATLLIQACSVIETARFTVPVALPQYAMRYDSVTGLVKSLNLNRQPVKYDYYQALQFPRNLDVKTTDGSLYIPTAIKTAQCEQAIYLKNLDDSAMANRIQGITMDKVSIGSGQIDATQEYAITGSTFSPLALELVRQFLVRGGRLARS